VFPIMFKTGQALLLPGGRFSRPRHGREAGAEQPRDVTGSWPQTRHFHDIKPVQDRTQPRIDRVREQSAIAFSSSRQSSPRTVHVRAQATASVVREQAAAAVVNRPQIGRSREQTSSANWSQTQFVRDRGPANSNTRRCIGVSAWASANFPVFIHIISPYEHI